MNTLKGLLVFVAFGLSLPSVADEVAIPNSFQAGTTAVAAEVNENFNAVAGAVNDNAQRLTQVESDASASSAIIVQNSARISALEAIESQLPTILDLSMGVPLTIDEPGLYVLDRDWNIDLDPDPPFVQAIRIIADQVTFDLRGFALDLGDDGVVLIAGNNVTLRNGKLSGGFAGATVRADGNDWLIDGMDIHATEQGLAASLSGPGSVKNSIIRADDDGLAMSVASGVTVQGNLIVAAGASAAIDLGTSNQLLDNVIRCGGADCLSASSSNVLARNIVTDTLFGLVVSLNGDGNQLLDNVLPGADSGESAILIDGTANILRGNILSERDPGDSPWDKGIVFAQDGNFYGDNLVSATLPFDLQGTSQIDLGGNAGL